MSANSHSRRQHAGDVLTSRAVQAGTLALIDVAPLRSNDPQARAAVAAQIRAACVDNGFFVIRNHGVSEYLQQQLFTQAADLFALPDAEKRLLDKSLSAANRGYEALGNQQLQPGSLPDLKEGYYMGRDLAADHPQVLAGKFNHGPNVWPTQLPQFRPLMESYLQQITELAELLMRGLALSLNLPENHFDDFCHEPLTTLRLLHYPPQPVDAAANQRGAGAHTDFGGLTLLLQDAVGGLQVWSEADQCWLDIAPQAGTYIINIGDMFARWTNDLYRSTLHRVINRSGRERYSIPFFYSGNADHRVECLPGCCDSGEPPRYAATTVEQHYREMYRRTYSAQPPASPPSGRQATTEVH